VTFFRLKVGNIKSKLLFSIQIIQSSIIILKMSSFKVNCFRVCKSISNAYSL